MAAPESGARTFAYKPALLARRQTVQIDADGVAVSDHNGNPLWHLRWDVIGKVALVDLGARRMHMSRIDLIPRDGSRRRSVSCTVSAGTTTSDPDYAVYKDAVGAITTRLAAVEPSLPVLIGEHGKSRWAAFLVGVASALAALVMAVLAQMSGRGEALMGNAMVPFLLLLLFGLTVAWAFSPWRRRPTQPVGAIAGTLGEAAGSPGGAKPPA